MPNSRASRLIGRGAHRWFFRSPRLHGELLEERSVGNLELFYDLVFVVFVGQLADHLAGHITGRGVLDFVVLFSVMWVTWFNGSIYHELHGREDGRARALMFGQILLLAFLATEAGEAGGSTGQRFALVVAVLLALQTLQWWSVYRRDEPQFRPVAGRYLVGSVIAIALAIAATLVEGADIRLGVWGAFLLVVLGGTSWLLGFRTRDRTGLTIRESLVERYGLFVIIVLGELVVGVVQGLKGADADLRAVATGGIALTISFGFWWTYFDLVGGRLPRPRAVVVVAWLTAHLPMTLSIAAAGAGMVSVVEYADAARAPAATAWLVSGAVAAMLITTAAQAMLVDLMVPGARERQLLIGALMLGAAAALGVGAMRPAPWLLVLLLALVLLVVWVVAFVRWLANGGAEELLDGPA